MRGVLLAAFIFLCIQSAPGQDAVSVGSGRYSVVFENQQFRVLLVRYGAGEKSPLHEHPPSWAIALTDRHERVTDSDGTTIEVGVRAGELSALGGKHISQNIGDLPFDILLVEYKTDEVSKAAPSLARIAEVQRQSPLESNEAAALSTLRTINTAEVTFAATYDWGFTDGLNRLGEPRQGQASVENADLVDPVMAGRAAGGSNLGFVQNGYRFIYTPGSAEFGTIATYSVIARPLRYGATGRRSFYTDESAVIRSTDEDRAATSNDPPL